MCRKLRPNEECIYCKDIDPDNDFKGKKKTRSKKQKTRSKKQKTRSKKQKAILVKKVNSYNLYKL